MVSVNLLGVGLNGRRLVCGGRCAASVLLAVLAFPYPASAAFNPGMQWDVRTTGSDANGGGFDSTVVAPGTDFSQQNAAQISYTDIVIGATTTQGTSAGHPFDATIPGNVINITAGAGCTVQRVEVLSVSGVTATFDKSLGTAASTCTGALGGSLLVPLTAINLSVSSNTTNIKSGTYTRTTTATFNGTPNGPLYIIGYGTTHADNGTAPLLTTATNSINIFNVGLAANNVVNFTNLSFSSTAGTPGVGLQANSTVSLVVTGCTFSGFKNAINGDNFGSTNSFLSVRVSNTEIKSSTSHAIIENGFVGLLNGTWIHGSTGDGVVATGTECIHSIVSGNSIGITGYTTGNPTQTSLVTLTNCTVANNASDGVQVGVLNGPALHATASIIYGNGGWGINLLTGTATPGINQTNAYGSNTSGNRNNFSAGLNDITLTASPFVSSTNFALNATAGGGAALAKAGFPGAFPGGTTTGYLDVGAVQTTGGPGTGTQTSYGVAH